MPEDTPKKEERKRGSFTIADLNDEQKRSYLFVTKRVPELQRTRQNHYGYNIDSIWTEADRDYIPHRLKSKGKKAIAVDEEKGWRSSMVQLGAGDWQSDVSQANPYVKIQTALSILIDQNPTGVFTPALKKFQATTEIIKQLYNRSWEVAKSKNQLKLFVFNLAKYGWAAARTYPFRIERKVKVLTRYNPEDPEKSEYEDKTIIEYNDIMRENLDVRNTWIDDMARPSNAFSLNDWCYRKVYDFDAAELEFSKYNRWKLVEAGGNTQEVIDKQEKQSSKDKDQNSRQLVEIIFYENRSKDLYMVLANGVPIIIEPLPIADSKGLKKLSIWQAYWNLRHSESPYGIGIYESIRYDQSILDRIRNMTIDQLTLSIYKMFFFQGTASLTETGDIKIQPGVGKQVLDPKNVNWLDVPGPGQDAFLGIEMFRKDVDEASGITDPLLGQVTGKTAFEIAQAKESALKRLKNPLENILEALNEEGALTIALMQLLYSIPETYEITDPRLIEDYLKEIGGDPDLYSRDPLQGDDGEPQLDTLGQPQTTFTAKVFPEFPLNLDKDEKGNLIETKDTKFFRTKPGALAWEGSVHIKSQSLLSPSKQVEKALDIEMYNLLIPLMQSIAQERDMKIQMGMPVDVDTLTNGKVVKNIVKLYDKDARDIFPDDWLTPPQQPLFLPMGSPGAPNPLQALQGEAPQAQKAVSNTQPPVSQQGIVGKIMNRLSTPFRGV